MLRRNRHSGMPEPRYRKIRYGRNVPSEAAHRQPESTYRAGTRPPKIEPPRRGPSEEPDGVWFLFVRVGSVFRRYDRLYAAVVRALPPRRRNEIKLYPRGSPVLSYHLKEVYARRAGRWRWREKNDDNNNGNNDESDRCVRKLKYYTG